MKGWVSVFLLLVSITLSGGVVALLIAFIGYQFGFAGWFVVALLGGGWILYLALLGNEYRQDLSAPRRENHREESQS